MKPAEERKYIMVIGGDIAGMEAARVSALRGHTVTLVERNGELGGVFIPASNMRFKKEDKELILDIPGVYHIYVPLYRGLPLMPIPPQPAAGVALSLHLLHKVCSAVPSLAGFIADGVVAVLELVKYKCIQP